MTKLSDFLPLVKGQIAHNQRCLKKYNENSRGWKECQKRINDFSEFLGFIESQDDSQISSINPTQTKTPILTLSPSDLEGLPPELLSELAISESDQADFQILAVIDERGGIATLDQILIGLYHKTGEIYKRTRLNSKVYRLIQKGLLKGVEGKKAVYALPDYDDQSEEDTDEDWMK